METLCETNAAGGREFGSNSAPSGAPSPGTYRDLVWLLIACATVFFLNLGGPALWDEDEPKNAACAYEMLSRNDWLVPTFNHELRTDKPILLYWLMLGAYHLLGVSEFSARIWSAVCATMTVLATWSLGRRLFSREVGYWGGVVLASSLLFAVSARAATPDAVFICCTTCGLAFYAARYGQSLGPTSGLFRFAPYVCWGLGVLAKGPAGIVLPLAVLACDFVAQHFAKGTGRSLLSPRVWWQAAGERKVLAGLMLVVLIAAPWYTAVAIQTEGAWLAGFLSRHNVQRFTEPLEGHGGPIFYYLPTILAGMLFWSLWLPGALVNAWRRVRLQAHPGDIFICIWAITYIAFFSLARTKLPSYVLPCYPALALLTARYLVGIQSPFAADSMRPEHVQFGCHRWPLVAGLCLALAVCIALPIAANRFCPGAEWLGLIGLVPLVGCVASWLAFENNQPAVALRRFAIATCASAALLLGLAGDVISSHQPTVAFTRNRECLHRKTKWGTLDCFQPTLVFYSRGRVSDLPNLEEAALFLEKSRTAVLVTREEQWPALRSRLPKEFEILDRRPMFLKSVDQLLIGRRAHPTPYLAEVRTRQSE